MFNTVFCERRTLRHWSRISCDHCSANGSGL